MNMEKSYQLYFILKIEIWNVISQILKLTK